MNNQDILSKLDNAFKSITVGDLGSAVLQPQKFERFVQTVQEKANILNEARFIEMDSSEVDIDRVGFSGRILKAGELANGDDNENVTAVKPVFGTNKLTAKELVAVTGIKDKSLRRNIEKEGFEDTLVDLFAGSAGKDLEEFAILADKDIAYNDDDVLSLADGWVKDAVNKVYGSGATADFDPDKVEELFESMILALPKEFLGDPTEWRIYAPFEVVNAYIEVLKARNTPVGDKAYTEAGSVHYKGFPVVYSPMIERSKAVGDGGAGRVCLLGHPDNMAWGLFHEITVEKDRKPTLRKTDFVLTLEGASGYEDENGAVVAYMDQEKPA